MKNKDKMLAEIMMRKNQLLGLEIEIKIKTILQDRTILKTNFWIRDENADAKRHHLHK